MLLIRHKPRHHQLVLQLTIMVLNIRSPHSSPAFTSTSIHTTTSTPTIRLIRQRLLMMLDVLLRRQSGIRRHVMVHRQTILPLLLRPVMIRRRMVLDILHDLRIQRHVFVAGHHLHVRHRRTHGRVRLVLHLAVRRVRCRRAVARCVFLAIVGGALVVEVNKALHAADIHLARAGSMGAFGTGAFRAHGRRGFVYFLAVRAVLDDETDGFFDSDPVELVGDCCRCFVDAAMLLCVYLARDFVLALWIRDYFFVFEHQSFAVGAIFCGEEFVMSSCTSQSAFLGSVGAVGVFPMFQVEADFVEALLGDEVFTFGTEVATVDDGVY